MLFPPEFSRYQRIIVYIYVRERTVPRTVKAIEEMTGEPYYSQSFVRAVVQRFKEFTAHSVGATR